MTAHRTKRASESLTASERLKDYLASCDYGNKALREQHIRRHAINPRPDNPEEQRWWDEGELKKGRGNG